MFLVWAQDEYCLEDEYEWHLSLNLRSITLLTVVWRLLEPTGTDRAILLQRTFEQSGVNIGYLLLRCVQIDVDKNIIIPWNRGSRQLPFTYKDTIYWSLLICTALSTCRKTELFLCDHCSGNESDLSTVVHRDVAWNRRHRDLFTHISVHLLNFWSFSWYGWSCWKL